MNLLTKWIIGLCLGSAMFYLNLAWPAKLLTVTYQDNDLAAPLTLKSQWRPSDAVLIHCRNQPAERITMCLQHEIEKENLPKVALRFNELTSAYITEYQKTGPLTVIKAFILGADHSVEFYIKNIHGKLIAINAGDVQKLLETQPLFQQQFKLPKNFLVAQLTTDKLPNITRSSNLWRTEFSFQLRNQCMACEILGKINVAYRFNKLGEFKDLEVVTVRLKK